MTNETGNGATVCGASLGPVGQSFFPSGLHRGAPPKSIRHLLDTGAGNKSRIDNSDHDPPELRRACETCGAPFEDHRSPLALHYRQVPAKRFCSEACRKKAERQRAALRRLGGGVRNFSASQTDTDARPQNHKRP